MIDGGTALATYLKSDKCRLRVLNLNSNRIDNVGGKEMALALRSNRTLVSLNIMSNNIGGESLFEIAKSLLHFNTTLSKIRVLNNKFDQKSMSFFYDIIAQRSNELSIDIVIDKVDTTYYVAQKKDCIKPDPKVNTSVNQIKKIDKILGTDTSLDGYGAMYKTKREPTPRVPDEYDVDEEINYE